MRHPYKSYGYVGVIKKDAALQKPFPLYHDAALECSYELQKGQAKL